jgi:superoxide dismutase, Fe-Mn family
MNRRDALRTLGIGLATAAATGLRAETVIVPKPAPAPVPAAAVPEVFVLDPLPYAADALEPHFDAETMRIHHGRHHRAYVNNANVALASVPAVAKLPLEELLRKLPTLDIPEPIRTALRNNAGGHHNHDLFWNSLAPVGKGGGGTPEGALGEAIARDLGGFDPFKEAFTKAAMGRFGSGWAWLSRKADGKLLVHSTANQDSPLMEGLVPLLGVDVWEHAYYLRYQNRRADYLAAFWNLVDWSSVSKRLV